MYDFLIYFSRISPLLVILVVLPLALVVFFNDRLNKVNIYYTIFVFLMCLVALSCFIQGITRDNQIALYSDWLFYISVTLLPLVYNRFTFLFTKVNRPKFIKYSSVVALCVLVLNFTPYFRADVVLKFDNRYIISPGIGWYIFLIYFLTVFSVSFFDLFFAFINTKGEEYKKLKYLFVGSFFAMLSMFFYFLLIPNFSNNFYYSIFNLASSFFVVVYGLFMVFNILYLKFLDVEVILKRSSYFVILFSLVILPFVLLVNFLTEKIFVDIVEYRYLLVAAFWTVFIISSEYIKEWMKNITDALFYAADYNYEKALDRVNRKLSEITDIYFLLYSLEEDIRKYIKVSSVGLFLPNQTKTKYYYLELDNLESFINPRKRSKLFSIESTHSLFTMIQRAQGNILVREDISKMTVYNDGIDIRNALSVVDSIHASALVGSLFKNKLNGILVVGKKKSGDKLKPKDFRLLRFMINRGSLVLMRIFEIEEKTRIETEKKMHMEHKNALSEKNDQLKIALSDLKDAQERLIEEEQLSAMGKLSGEVAHDIRNPLSAMNRLFTYVKQEKMIDNNEQVIKNLYDEIEKLKIKDKELMIKSLKFLLVNNKEMQSVIDETMQINDKLRKIADDFLDYSRTSKDIPTEKVNVFDSLDRMVSQFQVSEEVKKYDVKVSINKVANKNILMFDHQVQKVFMNIIDNAIKAVIENDKDEKFVEVCGYGTMMQDREMVCVSIKDNGVGIDPEHITTIFKPFYTKRKNLTGTGLGLAIVKKIVDDAGGDITVESSSLGTEFKVFLPCYD